MTQPVDVPLLDPFGFYLHPLLFAARCVLIGLLVGAIVTFLLVKVLGRRGVAGRWRVTLATGAALFLAITGWSWLSSSEFTVARVTADAIELRYAAWPWPARRFAFDEVESVSMSTWGRRARVHSLVITSKATTPSPRTHWESAPGREENIRLAIQWIEHASGGRMTRR